MDELLVGLDICDTYTQMSCAGQEQIRNFPTVICKKKNEDVWLVGQEAYACALEGNGVIVDKLLKLLRKEGTATIAGVKYTAMELMQSFLESVLAKAMMPEGLEEAVPETENMPEGGAGPETGALMETADVESDSAAETDDAPGDAETATAEAAAGETATAETAEAVETVQSGEAAAAESVEAAEAAAEDVTLSEAAAAGTAEAEQTEASSEESAAAESEPAGIVAGESARAAWPETAAAGAKLTEAAEKESVSKTASAEAATAKAPYAASAEAAPAESIAAEPAEEEQFEEPSEESAAAEPVRPAYRSYYDAERIGRLVITVPKVGAKLLDLLTECTDRLQIPRERVHIISHTEGFLYYVLSQKREVWNNQVGMFDLSEDFLCYYEMKVQRGMRQVTVMAEREKLDEGFNLDILKTPSGVKLADKILCACGQRFLQKKLFSSVFLTGKGFESQDWAKEFMKMVCMRRKVYVDQCLFVQGAVLKAEDMQRDKTAYPYVLICDGRLNTTVSLKITRRDQEGQLILASAGDNWYEARSTLEVILDNQQYLEFMISPADPKRRKLVKLTLEGFPQRDDKTVRVRLQVNFLDENTMTVTVEDMGFGEFYPSTNAVIKQEVML